MIEEALKYSVDALNKGQTFLAAIETFCSEFIHEAQLVG